MSTEHDWPNGDYMGMTCCICGVRSSGPHNAGKCYLHRDEPTPKSEEWERTPWKVVEVGELLAIIHRDGGHHTLEVGTAQSIDDAAAICHEWKVMPERIAELEAALAGMVRLHFADAETFEPNIPQTIAAVDLLAEAGRIVIDKDVRPRWIRARWIEEEPNAN